MKPENAVEMEVPCDFSSASMFHAVEKIDVEYMKTDTMLRDVHYTLKVNSAQLGEAIPIAFALKWNIEIDFTYGLDEWSLSGWRWSCDEKGCGKEDRTFWSPGA